MNLSDYREIKPHYFKRIMWYIINRTVFKYFIGHIFMKYRNSILRLFGAKIDKQACIYHSCIIYAPWNLKIGRACIGPNTELYNKAKIVIGNDCVVSQNSYLCTASHGIYSLMLPLKTADIIVENNVWIAANAFIGMGVTIGQGAIVGARACVFKDVEPWTVVGGNPAKFIKKREIKE
jgi:putative colanic acid biosynthesis acetyltransferase WcaF